MTLSDLPNLFERNLAAFRKLDVVLLRVAPCLAKVIRRTQKRAPKRTVHRGPQTRPSVAPVVSHRIDAASGKVWPGFFPFLARRIRAKYEGAFHGADQEQVVA